MKTKSTSSSEKKKSFNLLSRSRGRRPTDRPSSGVKWTVDRPTWLLCVQERNFTHYTNYNGDWQAGPTQARVKSQVRCWCMHESWKIERKLLKWFKTACGKNVAGISILAPIIKMRMRVYVHWMIERKSCWIYSPCTARTHIHTYSCPGGSIHRSFTYLELSRAAAEVCDAGAERERKRSTGRGKVK